ncbi:MAG: hypothetical protein GC183_04820 [Thiobacillus sp.]|nr:hypothetical protein [Thiobacillus sp.]
MAWRQWKEDRNAQRATAALMLVAACWFAAWPYMGLWHDSRLYALEALARLTPGNFDRDIFLAYGSQGKFTLFPGIFAALIERFGLEDAAFALTLAGKVLWIGSLAFLTRQLLPWPQALFGLLLVLAYPPFYDSYKVFSYGESFATPRLYAEALAFLALGAWLRGRHAVAWLVLLLAGLFHPLMAIPGAALLAWMTAAGFRRQQIAWLALGSSVAVVSALLAFPDLQVRLFSVYDPAWFDAIALRNPYVFVDRWGGAAFGRMAWIAVVLALVAREETGMLRRFAFAVLLITASLLVVSWLGTSVWRNILLTQLQLWRALWLAQVVALVLLAVLLPRLWKSSYADRILASCLVAAMLQDTWTMGLLALGGVVLSEALKRASASVDTRAFFWRILPYLIVMPWLLMHFLDMRYWLLINDFYLDKAGWRVFLADRVVMFATGLAAYWVLAQAGAGTVRALLGTAGAALLVAVIAWSPSSGRSGSAGWNDVYAQLKQDIPPGSVVASTVQGGVRFIWFGLERPSYVSQVQMAGGLFNRDTALEGIRRLQSLEKAGFPFSSPEWGGKNPDPGNRKVSLQSIAALCTDSGLDYVIMDGGREGAKQYFQNGRPMLSLFACRDFRDGRGAPL